MLSGPHQKFCEGIVSGLNATDAYLAAYPKTKRNTAGANGHRLLKSAEILAGINTLRAAAAALPGSAVLTLAEKRKTLAGIVRARCGTSEDGDNVETRDKLAAIKLDNDLAGEGSEAKGNEGLAALLAKIRK